MDCKLCGSPGAALKFTVRRFDPPFDVYECPRCGFRFRDLSASEACAFYDEAYYTGGKQFAYLDERANEKACRIVWSARVKKLARYDRSRGTKRFLDVGCSFGGLMQTAAEAGYEAYGAEVSSYSGGYARERFGEDRVFIGNIEDLALPAETFSIVTLVEVIEHLCDPRKALENVAHALQKGGVALVQTADMSGRQAVVEGADYHYYLPGHVSYFSRRNLETLMRDCGFTKVRYVGGVEFGLLPKLRKSRYSFRVPRDYLQWWRIAWYHLKSKITLGRFHWTSSMVVLGWK